VSVPAARQRPRLFIFDLDGTLVRFDIDWNALKIRIRAMLGTDDPLSPLLPSIERLVRDPRLMRRVYGLLDEAELAATRGFVPDDGVIRLFERLKTADRNVALVTLQGRAPAVEALARLGLAGFFDLILTRDETTSREEQIIMAVRRLAVPAGQTIVIADKPADMAAARRVGCLTFAVTDRPDVEADFKATSVIELSRLLGMESA
jgi:phosphoglycolate phosphatase-like HAD superfamily hydrolase